MTIFAYWKRCVSEHSLGCWWAMCALVFVLALPMAAPGQSNSATLTGIVQDTTGAALANVSVTVSDPGRAVERLGTSGGDGTFVVSNLTPGEYTLRASLRGFAPVEMRNLLLNVDDRIRVRIELELESRGETLTVLAETPRVNTLPSVSTVIDRQFVENLPLNGRSFQALLELTPGVVMVPSTTGNTTGNGGQFSVNGQRATSNSITVDGVSANIGISSGIGGVPGQSGSGQMPGFTAFGSTSGLVTVDGLQEFRIQTSGYAPEFGRTPGGQVSLRTRSGTNTLHGSFSDYFRHDKLNAKDWFVNFSGLPNPRMRQHSVGGVLGGPILRGRTFFFAAHERLRVDQPRAQTVEVPSLALRQTLPAAVRPFVNVAPLPNGREFGDGTAAFTGAWSDPLASDTTSLRLDHQLGSRMSLFGRVNYSPSSDTTRVGMLSSVTIRHSDGKTATLGATWIPSPSVIQDLRVNYSVTTAPYTLEPDDFGGAVPLTADVFVSGLTPDNSYLDINLGSRYWTWGIGTSYRQQVLNVVDSVTVVSGAHEAKFGLDFRRVNPILGGESYGNERLFFTPASLAAGTASRYTSAIMSREQRAAAFDNWSVYAQDSWRFNRRLVLTYGVRWELVPSPRATSGDDALAFQNLDNPYGGQVRIAPQGTPLWNTKYGNFAARVGGSYLISEHPGAEFVVKGGFGKFYDLGLGHIANTFVSYPFVANKSLQQPVSFPLSASVRELPQLGVSPPTQLYAMDPRLVLPYTWQWNVSAERSFGPQALTVTYVGAEGRDLLKLDRYRIRLVDFPTTTTIFDVNRNRGYSDYRSLQIQMRRRLSHGIQALASYTFGRSRDTVSGDVSVNVPAERLPPSIDFGYSDFDVRHLFTAAVSWQLPESPGPTVLKQLSRSWAADVMIRARTGTPINVTTNVAFPPDTETVRPDVVPGQPFWLDDPSVPGGRRLNRLAFATPVPETQGNLPRGVIHGLSAWQVDLTLRRDIRLFGPARLQLRAEAFNLFNTPMFSNPFPVLSSGSFGVSQGTLASALGGISSQYQMGGARSIQMAAKFMF